MSDTEGPASPAAPCALQFIQINEKGDSFELNEELLQEVLDRVPEGMPVSVVCVVGAFRTGKSFALDLFLRYLRSTDDPSKNIKDKDEAPENAYKAWLMADGQTLEGIAVHGEDDGETIKKDGHAGFSWRPGNIRNTTGMWIYSQPFIRHNPAYDPDKPQSNEPEKVAVLLVDTQGMFDMQTTQMLTAAIFGLSTLVSSYMVYNVEKRIQEDNLQHLALFTEYGRIALSSMQEEGVEVARQPFQTLQFLVRDFQDFDDEDDVEASVAEMAPYLNRVLEGAAAHKDLEEVRTHINMCFEKPSVFMLPHPGPEVTKKKYQGDVTAISPAFLALLHRLSINIFGTNSPKPSAKEKQYEQDAVVKKRIGEKYVSAQELVVYVRNYVKVFHEAVKGDGVFPEAKTLLAATAEANNYNAMDSAVKTYKTAMDKICGSNEPFVAATKIEEQHQLNREACLKQFSKAATMGSKEAIVEFREKLELKLQDMYEEYVQNNKNKQPDILRFVTILLMISGSMYLASSICNIFCWPPVTAHFDFEYADMCTGTMSILRDVYMTIFCFISLTLLTNCWGQLAPLVSLAQGQVAQKAKGD